MVSTGAGTAEVSDSPTIEIDFQFKVTASAPPIAAPVEKGPWAPIRVLYSGRAVPADSKGNLWHLEVLQPNFPNPGQQRSAWFELEFADPIPLAPLGQ